MGQSEVFELLRYAERPMSIDEISEKTGTRPQNVQKNVMRLRKRRELVVSCPGLHNGKFYYSVRGD